jgi:hypothetical protein
MKFLCVVYVEPETLPALPPNEQARLKHDSLAFDKELARRGNYIVAEALQPVSTARTVRVRHGKAAVTDGPFAETKEQLGGFILINAANIDEAVEIAAEIPMAQFGSVEVRPIFAMGGG